MSKITKKDKNFKWLAVLAAIFFILAFIILSVVIFKNIYEGKIYPGLKAGDLDLGGKTKEEVFNLLNQFAQNFSQEGILFIGENISGKVRIVKVSPIIISPQDPDLSKKILDFEIKKTTEETYFLGRKGSFFEQFKETLNNLFFKKQIEIICQFDERELIKILKDNFKDFEYPAQNAQLVMHNGFFEILTEKTGFVFDYEKGLADLKKNIKNLTYKPVNLKTTIVYPEITAAEGEKIIDQSYQISKLVPLKLNWEEKEWRLEEIKEFLNLKLDINKKAFIGLDHEKFYGYLKKIAKEIDLEPQEAEFEIKEGRVAIFKPSKAGRKLNIQKNFEKIEEGLIKNKNKETELIVEEVKAKNSVEEINSLGIKELIGAGQSNFSGSPKNRRHNIKVGAEKLNGVLIKPREEFSLNKALGKTGPEEGYLPELVIKGNKTTPEYGGGLCQIGTTAFRAALNSGLPILERHPHSYRVSYYEPAGMDATIYNPSPDLKFVNDAPSHILFLTRLEGDNLIFEFWGTSDGKKIEISKPKIFNIKHPGPPQYIESDELKPGEKKMIERAHDGADTEFTRTVTYLNGEKKEEIWKTHYKPWQAVFLIGKTACSTPESAIQN